jgi:hypothetical protein
MTLSVYGFKVDACKLGLNLTTLCVKFITGMYKQF